MKKRIQAEPNKQQKAIEAILGGLLLLTASFHLLILFGKFAYSSYNTTTRTIDQWLLVVTVVGGLLYAGFTHLYYPDTFFRVKSFTKIFTRRDTLLLLFLPLWYLVACLYMDFETGGAGYLSANRGYLLDAVVTIVIIYPLPMIFRRHPGYIEAILHLIMAVATVFMAYALVNLYQLNILDLPGGQVGMNEDGKFLLACHWNTTGAYGSILFVLAIYMILTHKSWWVRLPYIISALIHLSVVNLSNSRTSYYSILIFGGFLTFALCYRGIKGKSWKRLLIGLASAVAVVLLLMESRVLSFQSFEAITHFSELLGESDGIEMRSSLGDISGREKIYACFLPSLFQSVQRFLFGVTTVGVEDQITSTGLMNMEGQSYMHNQYLQMGIIMGFPGLAAYTLWSLSLAGKCVLHLNTPKGIALASMILMLVVANMFESYLFAFSYFCGSLFFLFSGMMAADDSGVEPPKKGELIPWIKEWIR